VPFEGAEPVGPPPVQPGGPPIWSGAFGPKSLRRAAAWADGVMGFSTAGDAAEVAAALRARAFGVARRGRHAQAAPRHRLLVRARPGAEDRLRSYVFDYLRLFGDKPARAMAERCRISSVERFRECTEAIAALGADELMLVPTTADPAELDRTAEALAGCKGVA
jgi:alkanesulfonate monooxygenase SsuD/methylene tetrahydromethanopterin reductase-like flavin-dependent oxidoreductase (luciferase family)